MVNLNFRAIIDNKYKKNEKLNIDKNKVGNDKSKQRSSIFYLSVFKKSDRKKMRGLFLSIHLSQKNNLFNSHNNSNNTFRN